MGRIQNSKDRNKHHKPGLQSKQSRLRSPAWPARHLPPGAPTATQWLLRSATQHGDRQHSNVATSAWNILQGTCSFCKHLLREGHSRGAAAKRESEARLDAIVVAGAATLHRDGEAGHSKASSS